MSEWAAGETLIVDQLVEYVTEPTAVATVTPKEAAVPLSRREREVIALVARGYTNRQIAETLIIGERTADGTWRTFWPSSALRLGRRPRCGPSSSEQTSDCHHRR